MPTSTPCPKKKRTLLREVSDTVRELKTLNETINRPEPEAHECDVFAAHIARQLKQLNASSCILAQQDIQGVVTRYRCRLLSKNLKIKIYRNIILLVVLYRCENWSLTLREERKLRVFENMVLRRIFGPRRDEVTGEWRRLHN